MSKALILIDYINEICHQEGKISGCAAMINEQQIVSKVNKLLRCARQENCLIVWIVVGFESTYINANLNSPIFSRAKQYQAFELGTWGTELLENLDYHAGELVIIKNAVNPFHATNLDHILRCNDISEVYVACGTAEVAIQSCARNAHERG